MRPTDSPNRTSAAVDRREWKAARRTVLVQCAECLAHASGTVNARKRIVSTNLSAVRSNTGKWFHNDCRGQLIAFDIEVGE